jgi:general secretion pathway protein I
MRRPRRLGFTLLEVMVAVVILAVGLSSLFTSEIGAMKIAQRARTTTVASLLARCKMGELEEKVAKEGWPGTDTDGRDECCEGAEREGFSCEWSIKRIVLPELTAEGEEGEEGQDKDGVTDAVKSGAEQAGGAPTMGTEPAGPGGMALPDPSAIGVPLTGGIESMLSGGGGDEGDEGTSDPIISMVMSYAFPVMKPLIEEQVRRATVVVKWNEGTSEQALDVVQFLVNELPMLAPDDDEENDPGTGGTGTGTGTSGTGTGTGAAGTGTGSGNKPSVER